MRKLCEPLIGLISAGEEKTTCEYADADVRSERAKYQFVLKVFVLRAL